jgi:branched-chain amino acid transport system permease protein
LGLSVVQVKVLVAAVAAFVAGVGGGFLASYAQAGLPGSYATLGGLVWLAVLVTIGIRSNLAAVVAGLNFTFFPALVVHFLSTNWGNVPPALFGIGAVFVAQNPDGALAVQARQLRALLTRRPSQSPPSDLAS